MKTIVVYASNHGCTEKCARKLGEQLGEQTTVVNLRQSSVDINEFDAVIVGGSIHVGKIQSEVTKFCEDNGQALLGKKLGLFLCCANATEVEAQIGTAFPSELREHATVVEHFGHEFNLEKLDFFSKLIVKTVAKVKKSESKIREENIQKMAEALS